MQGIVWGAKARARLLFPRARARAIVSWLVIVHNVLYRCSTQLLCNTVGWLAVIKKICGIWLRERGFRLKYLEAVSPEDGKHTKSEIIRVLMGRLYRSDKNFRNFVLNH